MVWILLGVDWSYEKDKSQSSTSVACVKSLNKSKLCSLLDIPFTLKLDVKRIMKQIKSGDIL